MTQTSGDAVIAGFAAATWIGSGVAPLFEAFERGLETGAVRRTSGQGEPTALAFPPLDRDVSHLLRKARSHDQLSVQLLAAIEADLSQALAGLGTAEREQTSVALGNTSGSLDAYLRFYAKGTREGPRSVNPADFPATLPNQQAVAVSDAFALTGPNTTFGSGVAAGLDAIGWAAERLALGREHHALAGGLDGAGESSLEQLRGADCLGNGAALRPLRAGRSGTLPAPGIGVLHLERSKPGGARGLAAVRGHASACGKLANGAGALRHRTAEVLRQALRAAGAVIGDVDAVFPSANGTRAGDALELEVLGDVFAARPGSLPVYPVKAFFGECSTAAGPLQCIGALYAMHHGRSPGAADSPRPPTNGELWFPEHMARCECALVYTLGTDGTASALVLERS